MGKRLAFFIIFLLFIGRLAFCPRLNLKDGQFVRLTGTLTGEPQVSGNRQKIKLGLFEIWTDRYPEYHYGNKIEAVGRVKVQSSSASWRIKVQNFTNFPLISSISPLTSSKRYLLNEAEIKLSDLNNLSNIDPNIKSRVIELRRQLKSNFIRYFPTPLDGLIAGTILGDKSLIPIDFWQKLKQTGTLHIMVASGMNIAMFSNGILSFFTFFFKRRLGILFVILIIWFYCLLTGMQPPIVRAGIMASLIYLSQLSGREAEGGRVLFMTAGLMLFANPFLLWDVGFQLSFLAMAGLIYLQPRIKEIVIPANPERSRRTKAGIYKNSYLYRFLVKPGMTLLKSENFSSSVAAQIATLPILISSFGQINLLSPLINFVILWTIPTILQFGMIIGLLGLLWLKLGEIFSYLLYPFLFYLEQAINLFAKITLFQVQLPKMGWWWGVGYYFLLWLWLRSDLPGFRADSH